MEALVNMSQEERDTLQASSKDFFFSGSIGAAFNFMMNVPAIGFNYLIKVMVRGYFFGGHGSCTHWGSPVFHSFCFNNYLFYKYLFMLLCQQKKDGREKM